MRALVTRVRVRPCARLTLWTAAAGAMVVLVPAALAETTPQALPFGQSWSDTSLISADDSWNGVPGIVGYRGDILASVAGTDPQTILADGSATPVDVNANQTSPTTFAIGGVAEFHLADPAVALNGSTTADAPHLLLHVNATGAAGVGVSYNLRDLDGSADNAQQQVALHYRVGSVGNYTNVPAAYVSDATTGSSATQVTNVGVILPPAAANQPDVRLRIMTTDAAGTDEWVGVDDISVVALAPVEIHEIQGAAHISPLNAATASGVEGIVTAKASNGFWIQDPTPDADDATSEGIFVLTSSAPTVNVGDQLSVSGTVTEFRQGGSSSTNLTTTEITSPTITVLSSGNPLPPATLIGVGGRAQPKTVIDDDAIGDVETSGVFDPAADGIDFYESLEGMLVQVNNPVAVGPTSFGEVPVLADDGATASVRTTRGGIVVRASDFNPERIILADDLPGVGPMPAFDVADHTNPSVVSGVIDYSFANFKLQTTVALSVADGGLTPETTATPTASQVTIATLRVGNLDPTDPQTKFDALAAEIVTNMRSPDILSLEEVQDNNGPTNDGVTDASITLNTLISSITAAGGPSYAFAQIDPVDDQDGGEPGGNNRVVFLFRTDRGVAFISKPGAGPTTANTVGSGGLEFSPGRIDPANPAFNLSRKPLAAEFTFSGVKLYLIANHFNSKGGDQPLFGHFQPPTLVSEVQRNQQAQVVNDFVDSILAAQSGAPVVVLGALNDYEFSTPLQTLKGAVLANLVETLPQSERYTFVFEGNAQALDHILVSNYISSRSPTYDVVHTNAEFSGAANDFDGSVLRFAPNAPTAVRVASLSASRSRKGVILRWRTGSEVDTLGFNLYRQRNGILLKLNETLISGVFGGSTGGHAYSWLDRRAPRAGALRYRLQAVSLDGKRNWVGSALVAS